MSFTREERTAYDTTRYSFHKSNAQPRRNKPTPRYNKRHANPNCRRRLDKRIDDNDVIEHSPALQRYFTSVKSRPRNLGFLSPSTKRQALNAARHLLTFLQMKTTNHSISELIQAKREKPQDFTLDDKLEEFSNEEPLRCYRVYASYMKGIFKANRARLQSQVDAHFPTYTKPISEGILKEIRNQLDERKK